MTTPKTESGLGLLDRLAVHPDTRPYLAADIAKVEQDAGLMTLHKLMARLASQKAGLTVELSTGEYISYPDLLSIIKDQMAAVVGPTEGELRALDGNR